MASTVESLPKKALQLNFPFDQIIAIDRYIKCEQKMVRQQQRILKGQSLMDNEIKIEWDMVLPEDQLENDRKTGSWTTHENLLYAIFINQHKSTMVSKRKRKNLRVFDRMADFIVSRNSLQCRSHHQKLIEKFMEIKNIINLYKKFFGNQYFREQTLQYTTKGVSVECQQGKNQQNINTPISLEVAEAVCDHKPETGSCEGSQSKTPQAIQEVVEDRRDGGECKMEQSLQYYYPMSYIFSNGLVQIPFYGFYPTCAYQ